MPARGVFVTGTDTGVGKSVVAAVIAAEAAAAGLDVAVFKPAVSGLEQEGEPDHELLARASGTSQSADEIAPYRYGPPLSPHLAAAISGEAIDPGLLAAAAADAADAADAIVCEGVGGLMVPLTPDYLVRNLATELGHPLVVAARPGLGTINHTLLTIEAAWAAELEVAAVVLTPWPPEPGALERSNRETIAALAGIEVRTLPKLDLAAPDTWPALDLL
ncbi:MAG: dethiobiotin synthase [Acidobacteria bacterium]|nr:MAG: dethiobiotin synthase [Acidobacteriota bacterium]MCL4287906.1 dethiobiotin synthase [Thermoleophilia bacterium]GIK76747.1 MAG: ATP-dependent dethiobiotin synthetase BioD [Actinomycetes bacterium]